MSAIKLNNPLMHPHLIPIPSFRTLTTWGLPSSDPHPPGGHGSWPLDFDGLVVGVVVHVFGSAGDFGASFVDHFSVGGGDGDPDVVGDFVLDFVVLVVGHFC